MALEIRLPANGWKPRDYQRNVWRYLDQGGTRACAIWHRRAGKDEIALHHAAKCTVRKPATYWHMLPEFSQARRAIWEAVNPHTGRKRIDEAFPHEMRARTNQQTMTIETITGSVWQVVGSDSFDSLVGAPPAGVVFSEWALADPRAWAFIKPILDENGGWALFITTPRGRNHAINTLEAFRGQAHAFAEVLPATVTGRFTPERLAEIEAEYASEFGPDLGVAMFRQEYLCDFDAPVMGSYYARLMNEAEQAGRFKRGIYDPALPVETWWDLGISDATAIWFVQVSGREFRFVDYLEQNDAGLESYAAALREKSYRYQRHILPHDGDARELGTGLTRIEVLRRLMPGQQIIVAPRQDIEDGINALQQILPRAWFDPETCKRGIEALRAYHRAWDDERKTFKLKPEHDWSSHGADAARTGALMWRAHVKTDQPAKPRDRWSKLMSQGEPGGWTTA